MIAKKLAVLVVLVEVSRRQNGRKHWHIRIELNPHQPVNHRRCNELVLINSTVYNEGTCDDCVIVAGSHNHLHVQGNLEGTRNFETLHHRPMTLEMLDGRLPSAVDDVSMPVGAYIGDPMLCK